MAVPDEEGEGQMFEVGAEEFHTKKLVNKLIQQVHDPVVLASGALPEWCYSLTLQHRYLFPFEVRDLFFGCTAFGTARYVDPVWLHAHACIHMYIQGMHSHTHKYTQIHACVHTHTHIYIHAHTHTQGMQG